MTDMEYRFLQKLQIQIKLGCIQGVGLSTAPARLYLLLALLLILLLDPVSHEKALPHFNEMRQPALARPAKPFSTYLYTGIFLDYFPVFNYYCVQYFSFRYRCSEEYNSYNIQVFYILWN